MPACSHPLQADAPPEHRSNRFLLLFALAYAGGVIGYLPLLSLFLPARIEAMAGATRLDLFTITVIAGAVSASLSNIIFGWLSDRSVAHDGGRRRWVAFGATATAFSYAGIALAASPIAIVLAIIAFQFALNALLAPLMAIMADEIPDGQKGIAGGLLTFANPLAAAVSALLIAFPTLGDAGRMAVIPFAAILCVAPFLLTRSQPTTVQPVTSVQAALSRRDLGIAWVARLLVQVSGVVLSLYLFFYFESLSAVPPETLSTRVAQLLTIAHIAPLPVAIFAGRLSDRIGRRKPFLIAAAALAALGLLGMAWAQDFIAAAIAFSLFSIGAAVFLALHQAFSMQLLPDPRHRGRDLGLINLTNTLPSLLGPLLAWSLATPHDFDAVMLALAGLAACGAALILAVREHPAKINAA